MKSQTSINVGNYKKLKNCGLIKCYRQIRINYKNILQTEYFDYYNKLPNEYLHTNLFEAIVIQKTYLYPSIKQIFVTQLMENIKILIFSVEYSTVLHLYHINFIALVYDESRERN